MAFHHGKHGNSGRRVVLAVLNGQCPEVWRGPQEDEQEQKPRGPGQRIGDRSPADQYGNSPSGAADNDVLLTRALQPQGIDEHVEERGRQCQTCRQEVGTSPQDRKSENFKRNSKNKGVSWGDQASHQRTSLRALHQSINVPIDVHVDCIRAAGSQRAANQRDQDETECGPTAFCHHHRWNRGDKQQLNDSGLCESNVATNNGSRSTTRIVSAASQARGDDGANIEGHSHSSYGW